MKIGFTGTQEGMTQNQKNLLKLALEVHFEPGSEFHHGDCVGADAEACDIAKNTGYIIHCHPPIKTYKRAYKPYDVIYEAKEYIARNHDIVDSVEFMYVAPKEREEQLRSGTWATYRYTKKTNTRYWVISP